MLSFAKNDRGFRLASAAMLLAPVAWLIISMSRSETVELVVGLGWCVFAALALLAFLFENAEEEAGRHK